jgi:CubicO group peptidase (beta-lactamase class C family)
MVSRAQVASSKSNTQVMSGLLWLCMVFLLGGCGGALQPRAPDPEYGKGVAKEFEAAFNGGWNQMDRFEQDHWVKPALGPSDERYGRYTTQQRGFGRIRMQRVEREGDAMVALAQTEFGDWLKCFLVFGGGGDRLLDVRWLQAAAPEWERGPRSEQELTSDLDGFLERFSKGGGFSGAVLVARRGQVIFEKAYGEASREPSIPNQVTTRFNIASVEKIFTAVIVFELIEERKLALGGKLCDYLPNYPLKEACPITIDQLLTHTSGLPDMVNPRLIRAVDHFKTPQDYIDTFGKDPLTFKPGKSWAYSNFGYAVLGRIVEAVEGKPFAEVMTKRIYEKANMKDSTRLAHAANASDVAVPYAFSLPNGKGKLEYGPERDARQFLPLPSPFCCSFTTVRDLFNFSQALMAGRLVSKQSLELMVKTDRSGPGDLVDHYGYGVMTDLIDGVPYFGHDGGIWGVNAVLRMTPEDDVVVVLSNVSPGAAQRAAMRAADQLARLPKSADRKPSPVAATDVGLPSTSGNAAIELGGGRSH